MCWEPGTAGAAPERFLLGAYEGRGLGVVWEGGKQVKGTVGGWGDLPFRPLPLAGLTSRGRVQGRSPVLAGALAGGPASSAAARWGPLGIAFRF